MTLRTDVARRRDLLACWRELAEKRLEYLTEMFESGRWRRYYSEFVFLENIREAKAAVETWRVLSTPDPARNSIIDISWSAPERTTPPRKTPPRPQPNAVAPPEIVVATEIRVVAKSEAASVKAAPAAARIDMLALQRALDDKPKAAPDAGPPVEGHTLLRYTL
jgi:uncharacterized repeat protein (TIGR03809 family)